LRLVVDLPDTRELKQQELDLQVTLANALIWARGHTDPEVAEALRRAHTLVLATQGAGTELHLSVLYGLVSTNYIAGDPRAALEYAEKFLSLAQSQTESGYLLMGHRLVGLVLLVFGNYPAALSHLERAVTLYLPDEHRTLALRFGADIGVSALSICALALWHQGYPGRANKVAREALRHARQSAHLSLAYALFAFGVMAISARWAVEAEELGNELVTLSREHGFPLFSRRGLIFQGWAMAQRGQGMAAVERIREGLSAVGQRGG
jgi:tetratricopeptide (TPR) repeat protein